MTDNNCSISIWKILYRYFNKHTTQAFMVLICLIILSLSFGASLFEQSKHGCFDDILLKPIKTIANGLTT